MYVQTLILYFIFQIIKKECDIILLNKNSFSLDNIKPRNTLHNATEDVLSNNIDPSFYDGELQNAVANANLENENVIK